MDFKDYYGTLGIERTASHDDIRRAYRKLARKFHPDVSQEPDAEARFKEIAEAHEALIDVERRAAYDGFAQRHAEGRGFEPPAGWERGFAQAAGRGAQGRQGHDAGEFSDFFESIFGRHSQRGRDHHASVAIELLDACHGTKRLFSLHMPAVDGAGTLQERQLEVDIPAGVRAGQHLRLAGQGAAGRGGAPAGDLYLEIHILPHALFRLDGGDIDFELPVSPWEAALGATVTAPTPDGAVELTVPAGSVQGRRLRLKGRGLPGRKPGDLYAVLHIVLPPATSGPEKDAYGALAHAFADYNPRAALEA